MKNRLGKSLFSAILSLIMLLSAGGAAWADVVSLPHVSPEMTHADYWKTEGTDALLADRETISAINAAALSCKDCMMLDLLKEASGYDGGSFQRRLLSQTMQELAKFLNAGYYDSDGESILYADMAAILEAIDGAETSREQEIRYGICVAMTDMRVAPTAALITDEAGDNDFDLLQMHSLKVNEPVLIRAETAGGMWLYCDSVSVSGWVQSENIAVCRDREQWLSAWKIPEEELLVVTQGKIYLDESNVNAAASQRMLTMGTCLRRVGTDAFDAAVTNRAAYQNHAVYLPVREADGSYGTTIALIPQHCSVSEGWLPLTQANILDVAFSMLGDAYGWGGMLSVPDCSLYVRNVYKCFGLELPRNTTWQSAMPAQKYPLSDLDAAEKAALLDTLPCGTILFFNGHEMLYLGTAQGMHYVLSTVSSMMAPDGDDLLRVRSVVINTLEDTRRRNGRTWLTDLNMAVIPYQASTGEEMPSRLAGAYRSMITNTDCSGDMIHVLGQCSPDPDTVSASLAYTELLRYLGLNAQSVVREEIGIEIKYALECLGVEAPPVLDNISGKQFVLVDHAQALAELPQARIVGILDHPDIESAENDERIHVRSAPVIAASTLVYLSYRECEVPISRNTARLMLMGIYSAMQDLPDMATEMDRFAYRELLNLAEIEDPDALWQRIQDAALTAALESSEEDAA